jgi:hypothetical protein
MILNPIPNVKTLEAIDYQAELTSGRTIPLVMKCISPIDDEIHFFVVKFYSDMELGVRGLARELFASLLSQALGITTPEAAIINVFDELYYGIPDLKIRKKLKDSPGLNYGCKYLTGVFQFSYLPSAAISAAVDVFAFDMLIHNYDRRVGKPNMFQTNEDLIIFDHEMAFPYASPNMIIGGVKSLKLERNANFIVNHVLYKPLRTIISGKKYEIMFEPFVDKIAMLSDEILDRIGEEIPDEWHSDEIANIKEYIRGVRDNSDSFLRNLQEVLA